MNNHALFPFKSFYEWVERDGKPTLINFKPDHQDEMWAPCLWDRWVSNDVTMAFESFALITDDPPSEVQRMGHDRCPIFLNESLIDEWLNPKGKSKEAIYNILKNKTATHFGYQWVT